MNSNADHLWSTTKRNIDSYRFVKFSSTDFKVLESAVRKDVRFYSRHLPESKWWRAASE